MATDVHTYIYTSTIPKEMRKYDAFIKILYNWTIKMTPNLYQLPRGGTDFTNPKYHACRLCSAPLAAVSLMTRLLLEAITANCA